MVWNREKIILITIGILAYLLPFSTRLPIAELTVFGTDAVNDFTRVFIFAADLAVLAASLILLYHHRRASAARGLASLIFLTLFVSWAGLGFLLTTLQSAVGLAAVIRLILALILFYTVTKMPPASSFLSLSIGLVAAGVVQTLIGTLQFILKGAPALPILGAGLLKIEGGDAATFTAFGEKFLRAYGTLPHPNILAFFLLISLLAAYSLTQIFKGAPRKIIITAMILIAAGLILTFSRIFISLAALGLAIMWLINQTNQNRRGIIKKAALAGGAVILILLALLSVRPVTSDDSFKLRSLYDNVASAQAENGPVLGTGIGQSVLQGNQELREELNEQKLEYQTWMHQPTHSTYLLVLAETGWVGLILFFLFLIYATNHVYKKLRRDPVARATPFFVFAAVSAILVVVAMFFEHLFLTNANSLYLTIIVLALLAVGKEDIYSAALPKIKAE